MIPPFILTTILSVGLFLILYIYTVLFYFRCIYKLYIKKTPIETIDQKLTRLSCIYCLILILILIVSSVVLMFRFEVLFTFLYFLTASSYLLLRIIIKNHKKRQDIGMILYGIALFFSIFSLYELFS